MTIEELIRELQGLPQDTEVRFASQPSWPFEYSISSVVFVEEETEAQKMMKRDGTRRTPEIHELIPEGPIDDDSDPGMVQDDDDDRQGVVYLVEGRQIGYLPGNVKDEIGW